MTEVPVPGHGGREIKTIGDAFLVEFGSAVAAAECALRIQKALVERRDRVVEEDAIRLRVGLHLGDVLFMDDDVYGDGVNIAALMESSAEPDGICISGELARQIENKMEVSIVDRGKKTLKNIPRPRRIYQILLD